MGVTHTVIVLAARHGLDPGEAALAALLHDMCKEVHPKVIRTELEDLGAGIPAEDRDFPRIWHGLYAAEDARRQYGIEIPEVLEAVALHTTSDAGVGPLTKALYVADFTEPNREIKAAPAILRLAMDDLEAGYREALAAKTRHVVAKRGALNARGVRALRECCAPGEAKEILSQAESPAGGI